jgi:DNA helicase HerA-like ATPase
MLSAFDCHEIVELPGPDRQPGRAGSDREQATAAVHLRLITAVATAHSVLLAARIRNVNSRPEFGMLWLRGSTGQRLRIIGMGRPVFPPAVGAPTTSDHLRPVLYPPGAKARPSDGGELDELLARFPAWLPCAGRADSLWVPDRDSGRSPRRGAFDDFAAALRIPFAWWVLAEPMTAAAVQPEIDRLVNQLGPLSRNEGSDSRKVAAERLRARHRELSRLQETGCWRIRVLVGGVNDAQVQTAAATLCAAAELDGHAYEITPTTTVVASPTTAWSHASPSGDDYQAPFTGGNPVLAALARPPQRELPGIRVVAPRRFDVTPEGTPGARAGLRLGEVLHDGDATGAPLTISRDSLLRHTFVCGATGSGKSMTIRHLLTEASRHGVPWLVVEPAKAEYGRMAARLHHLADQVIVINPSLVNQPAAGLNPLEPAAGFPLQTHADLIRALFIASFEPAEPFPQVIAAALNRCYRDAGWELGPGTPDDPDRHLPYPTLSDLVRAARHVVDEIDYGPEVTKNVRGFISIRVDSLRSGTTGRFFQGSHPIDFEALLRRHVVLQIEDVGDDADKAFFMGVVLVRLVEHLRQHRAGADELAHLTVIEEAHRLMRNPDTGGRSTSVHAVEMFASMLAEVRAYGEGLIIAEQIPRKIIPDVLKNTAVKVMHRLPAQDDRDAVGATMNLDDQQSESVVSVVPGVAAVFTDGMDRPVLVAVPDGRDAEKADATSGPIGSIIRSRSSTCGPACRLQPCSAVDIRSAEQLLARRPPLVVWAELTVVAHLIGEATPVPRSDAFLLPQVGRSLDCALSHAVDDAVAARIPELCDWVDIGDLADHVAASIRGVLSGAPTECAEPELSYLSTAYRWLPVITALTAAKGPRHPSTADWERTLGEPIPGADGTEQLAHARLRHHVTSDPAGLAGVLVGHHRPPPLLAATGSNEAAIRRSLALFANTGWATRLWFGEPDTSGEEPP